MPAHWVVCHLHDAGTACAGEWGACVADPTTCAFVLPPWTDALDGAVCRSRYSATRGRMGSSLSRSPNSVQVLAMDTNSILLPQRASKGRLHLLNGRGKRPRFTIRRSPVQTSLDYYQFTRPDRKQFRSALGDQHVVNDANADALVTDKQVGLD